MDPDGRLRPLLEPMRRRAPGLHRFLTTDKRGPRIVREILSVVLIVGLLLLGIWIYTGQPLNDAPVVVVESGSMMHCADGLDLQGDACAATSWGRLGTIDPGDVIFVRDVDGPEDVRTHAEDGKERYGLPGDVVVYRPGGNSSRTPVIHRALFWMEAHGDGTISVLGTDIRHVSNLTADQARQLGLQAADAGVADDLGRCAAGVGLVTGGDNNAHFDMVGGNPIAGTKCPLPATWLVGKARGEIPWLGMLKLRFTDQANYAGAPDDVKTLMWLSVGVILFGPFVLDVTVQTARRRIAEARARKEPPGRRDGDGADDGSVGPGAEGDARDGDADAGPAAGRDDDR